MKNEVQNLENGQGRLGSRVEIRSAGELFSHLSLFYADASQHSIVNNTCSKSPETQAERAVTKERILTPL